MITADPMVTFPACPTFGFTLVPRLLVKIIARENAFEHRDRKWANTQRSFTGVPTGQRPEADIESMLYFFHAIGGTSTTFRFKDWADFKSCRLGGTPSALDQPFELTGDSPHGYRLSKNYTVGSLQQSRRITRPRGGTILIANTLGATQDGANWTLDEATGILVTGGGFVGTPGSWGGEFDVPCRFDGDLTIVLDNYKIQSATAQLLEDRRG